MSVHAQTCEDGADRPQHVQADARSGVPLSIGYRWVRYGPGLLLIRTRTRRVVDVIYGAFT